MLDEQDWLGTAHWHAKWYDSMEVKRIDTVDDFPTWRNPLVPLDVAGIASVLRQADSLEFACRAEGRSDLTLSLPKIPDSQFVNFDTAHHPPGFYFKRSCLHTPPPSPPLEPFLLLQHEQLGHSFTFTAAFANDSNKFITKELQVQYELENEINAYRRLKDLAGVDVPMLFGAYKGGEEGGGVLLLQDVGKSLRNLGIGFSDREINQRVYNIVVKLHEHGVEHWDVADANVMRGEDGRIRLIDFAYSKSDHQCPGEGACESLQHLRVYVLKLTQHCEPFDYA
ncbi:hypothetical protein BT69DRAFT_90108 [Atractiella rhizophila]|nr:hypothetical protein BT69DRAFT_90108 [Atractiella rhizophila]